VDYPRPANASGTQSKLSLPMPKSEPKSQLNQLSQLNTRPTNKKNAIISIKMTVYCRFVDIGSQFMCPSAQVGGKFRAGKHGA